MTAIQQFWLVETPTILTSTIYPVAVKDTSTLSSFSAISAGFLFVPIVQESSLLVTTIGLSSGALSSTAQFKTVSELLVNSSISLSSGNLQTTALFSTQSDVTVTSSTTITGGGLLQTALFYQADVGSGITGAVSITAGA